MTFYEQRLSADREQIQKRVVAVGRRVHSAIQTAVNALLIGDHGACSRIVLGDLPINREVRSINRLCHTFIARHLPSGGHLRFVSAVLQMNVALERIGDYAVTIAREGIQLSAPLPPDLAEELRRLATQATSVFEHALLAYEANDASLARSTKPEAGSVGRAFAETYRDLITRGTELALRDAFALFTVYHRLERVGDQAKNLCEDTLFELTGETKPPRRYEILFVDARSTIVAPLAAALARKSFPKGGNYVAAGYQAGDALSPEVKALAAELALELPGPQPLPPYDELERFHVIVGLTPNVRQHIPKVPYATIFLQWDLPLLADANGELSSQLREISRELSNQVHELMTTMHGEEAA